MYIQVAATTPLYWSGNARLHCGGNLMGKGWISPLSGMEVGWSNRRVLGSMSTNSAALSDKSVGLNIVLRPNQPSSPCLITSEYALELR